MTYAIAALQIVLSIAIPALILKLEKHSRIVSVLSPVVICYMVGMLFGNQPWLEFSDPVALNTCNVTVALAIPLLLFSVNIVGWLRLAKSTVLSFFLCIVVVTLSATLAHLIFRTSLDESATIAGMLSGVYTGGTPNMAAIGTALKVREETFILLNAADMVVSFAYLLFVLTVARRVLGKFLPTTPASPQAEQEGQATAQQRTMPPLGAMAISLGLAIAIVAVGALAAFLMPEGAKEAVAILLITSGAVLASTFRKVRALPGTQDMGQYLLLVFCVAMGFTTDFGELFSSPSSTIAFAAVVICGAVAFHLLLATILRIDCDTVIITSTAAIFGPHMVGPVAVSMKNREILFSGLASGLVGYAVGNYLGIGLAWFLTRFLT